MKKWTSAFLFFLGVSFTSGLINIGEGKSIGPVSAEQSSLVNVYPFSVELAKNLSVFWVLLPDHKIELALLYIQPTGWFSIGFGAYDDGHCRSDMIVGINGQVQDRYSIKEEEPPIDKKYNIYSGVVNNTTEGQLMVFTRHLKTSDDFQDREIFTSFTTKVVWAWGPVNLDGGMGKHPGGGYGTLWINFKTGEAFEYKPKPLLIIKFMFPVGFLLLCLLYVRVLSSLPSLTFLHREYFLVHFFKYSLPELIMLGGWIGINVLAFLLYRDPRKEFGVSFAVPVEISSFLLFLTVLKSPHFNKIYGISYEKQIKYHRFFSWVAAVAVLAHTIITLINFATRKILADEFTWEQNVYGIVACGFMVVISGLALRYVRRNRWEVFKFPHFLFYLFFAFGALHEINIVYFSVPGLALYVVDRVYRLFLKFFYKPTLVSVDNRLDDVTILKIDFKRKYLAGQFLEIMFPEISKVQSHPFSISSSPSEEFLTVHARSLGKWSHKVHSFSKATKIWVDGPYGIQPNWRDFEVVVLFAGGIGATPWVSIVRDHVLSPFMPRPSQLYFYPSFKSSSNLEWFADTWEMANRDPSVHITKYITGDKGLEMLELGSTRDESVKPGRPPYDELLSEICKANPKATKILVMACGPGRMMRQIQSTSYYVGREHGKIICFKSEVFKY